jgi:hypothetical protein
MVPRLRPSRCKRGVNLDTGVVTGSVTVTDADGDVIGYSTMNGFKGTAIITAGAEPNTFNFTYFPTQQARDQAAQTPGPDTDSITAGFSDGSAAINVGVAVPVEPRPADMPNWQEPTRNFSDRCRAQAPASRVLGSRGSSTSFNDPS